MIQYIYDNLNYEEPFVLTYIGTSLFFVYIPGWFILSWFGLVKNPRFRQFPYSTVEECWETHYEMVAIDERVESSYEGSFDDQEEGTIEGGERGMDHGPGYRRDGYIDSDEGGGEEEGSSKKDRKVSDEEERESFNSGLSGISDDINSIMSPIILEHHDIRIREGVSASGALRSKATMSDHDLTKLSTDEGAYEPPTHIMSHLGTMRVSLIVCPLWFLANWSYNQSLSMTSVTSSTIISTTSSLFSFILSVIFTGEKFTGLKLFGVLFCMGGTVMITLSDGDDGSKPTHELMGDLVALFSSIAYSAYTVVIKRFVPNDDVIAMPLLLGYLGLFNVILLAPVLLLITVISRGAIFNHFTPNVFGLICAEGIFDDVLSDYLWARAVVLTTPTIATVGLSLTIPLAFITDAIFHGIYPTPLSSLGAFAVVAGFVLVNVGDGSCEMRCKYLMNNIGRMTKKCCGI